MNTIANASNVSESTTLWYAITFRPCENHTVTNPVTKKRQRYGLLSEHAQKVILECTIQYFNNNVSPLSEIFFETTYHPNRENRLIHFHAILKVDDKFNLYKLRDYSELLCKRYGPRTYKAFDYKPLLNDLHLSQWRQYIRKEIKHTETEWTAGI